MLPHDPMKDIGVAVWCRCVLRESGFRVVHGIWMPPTAERNVLLTHCLDCDVEGSTKVCREGRSEDRSSLTEVQISFVRTCF